VEGDGNFGHWMPPGGVTVRSQNSAQDGQWHHLVGVIAQNNSGPTYSIYLDGQLKSTVNGPALTQTAGGWLVGVQSGVTYGFRGLLKDLRMYDSALSAAQVQALYAEGARFPASPSVSSRSAPPAPVAPQMGG